MTGHRERTLRPVVSVVLPSYRAADVARQSVDELIHVLDRTETDPWEIIIVDDGGGDFEPDPWHDYPDVRVLRFRRNRGKGAAVRAGMLAATGDVRVYTDADLPYGALLIPVMTKRILGGGCHVAIGDRHLRNSSYQADIPLPRRLLSFLCSAFVGTLVTGGFFDTQCGLKAVRGDIADRIFPLVQIEGFAFDVEVIYLALRHNCVIRRFPVRLRSSDDESSVKLFRDTLRAVSDIVLIKRRALSGQYDSEELFHLVEEEVERELRSARTLVQPGAATDGA